jgi:hypothetical protein
MFDLDPTTPTSGERTYGTSGPPLRSMLRPRRMMILLLLSPAYCTVLLGVRICHISMIFSFQLVVLRTTNIFFQPHMFPTRGLFAFVRSTFSYSPSKHHFPVKCPDLDHQLVLILLISSSPLMPLSSEERRGTAIEL